MGPLQLTVTWYKKYLTERASCALGHHPKQSDSMQSNLNFLCCGCPGHVACSLAAKGPLHKKSALKEELLHHPQVDFKRVSFILWIEVKFEIFVKESKPENKTIGESTNQTHLTYGDRAEILLSIQQQKSCSSVRTVTQCLGTSV